MMVRPTLHDRYRRNDIIVVTEPSFFGWFIRRCQRRCPERYSSEESLATHAGLIEQWPIVRESLVLRGVAETDYSLSGAHTGFVVLRNVQRPLRPLCERCDPVHHMLHLERGRSIYDFAAVAGMYLLSFGLRRRVDNLWNQADGWFCTEAVAECFNRAAWPLPTELRPAAMWPAELIRLWHRGLLGRVIHPRS